MEIVVREQNETVVLSIPRGRGASGAQCSLAKHKLAKRLTLQFLHQTLDAFHRGDLDTDIRAQLLSVSRAHLFQLRAA